MAGKSHSKSTRSKGQASPPWLQGLSGQVRNQRRQLKLSQIEVSDLAGCGPVFLYELEKGDKSTLRLDKVLAVLEVLGLEFVLQPGKGKLTVLRGSG